MATAQTRTVARSRTLGPRNWAGRPGLPCEEGPCLSVEYSGREVQTALAFGEEILWSGPWEIEIRSNGRGVEPCSPWEEVCWLSDDGVCCLELEGRFSEGIRVQRFLLSAWEERFVLLADAIFAPSAADLEYCARLPLGDSIRFAPAEESWEGFLRNRGRRALVLPLGLPEWRASPAAGALAETRIMQGHHLELRQAAHGRALWAPMFIDLDAHRFRRQYTWRPLTVAENLRALPPDVAVGYRVLVGPRQWLIYRSLAARANRSVLGHNLATEMVVARFERKGQVEPIMEIE